MVIARVLFPLMLPEPFDYDVPDAMSVVPGSYVRAPLGKQDRVGLVWGLRTAPSDRPLKPLREVFETAPMTDTMRRFIDFAARYNVAAPGQVLAMALRAKGGLAPSASRTVYSPGPQPPTRLTPARTAVLAAASNGPPRVASVLAAEAGVTTSVVKRLAETGALLARPEDVDPPFDPPDPDRKGFDLSPEQADAARAVTGATGRGMFASILLDGVTGSGKTEVYFEAISAVLKADPKAQILVLLPEIALTQAVLERFQTRFDAEPAAWHSGLSEQQRRRSWREIANGRARIIVGARSALFLPFQTLSLIIVDEEHDTSYKQEDGVTYQARDMAVMRAKLEDAVIILASATPALETMVNAEQGRYSRLRLSARPGSARLPDIDLIDMRADAPERGQWLSPTLRQALTQTLQASEQSLLFLNRRGYAPLVICKSCGERLKSPATDSWLTEHRYTGRLVCHLTGWSMPKPSHCPHCQAEGALMGVGPGVERVAEEVRILLPAARVEVFSSDTAQGGTAIRDIIARMATGDIDVLIGTQIVAKGHNFPNLTLVGIIDADSGLQGGDLRAGERTYQLLSQVAGRAGRAERPGRALVQTYQPDNPAMQALARADRDTFLAIERDVREELQLPPFGRMAALILSAPDAETATLFGRKIAEAAPNGEDITVYGPAPAPIGILRGRFRFRFLITAPKRVDLSAYMTRWVAQLKLPAAVRLSVDIDPYSFL